MKYIIQTLIKKAFGEEKKSFEAFCAMNAINWGDDKDPIIEGIKLILENKGIQKLIDIENIGVTACKEIVKKLLF